jgi:L-lactate dehydrogenase complex protein LldF
MSALSPGTFPENARAALGDQALRAALRRATDLFAERRARAVAEVPDWEALRERARAIKDATLARLDEHLERFAERASAAGARVHWARDGREACRIVAELAHTRGARRLVKSKSMTTEEIALNAALQRAGCEPVETDLGEWIIQLAGETPSHIIVPAIHKSKAQIGALFVDKLGIERSEDAQVLAAHARARLRAHFARADLGISGVNFGVAETGSILILENEGNARMTTTLPRVHVAVMGIEKVVPELSDLEVFLRLLPRSGTGQHLTSYQTLLTGPDPASPDPDGHAGEGPEELHIVLLDNGRSLLLGDARTRQTLACIRCGACLNACPVYQEIGGHAYGSVYPGPIGAILTPQLPNLAGGLAHGAPGAPQPGPGKADVLAFASSLCGACRDVCPVKIDIPEILLLLRARAAASAQAHGRLERLAWRLWAWSCSGPRRFALAARLARAGQHLSLVRRLGPLGAWHSTRELPELAPRSFRQLWREERR